MIKWGLTCFFEDRQRLMKIVDLAREYPILKYIEIRGERPFFSPEDLKRKDIKFFRRVIEKSGLEVTVHATFYDINLSTINSYLRKANLQCYKTYLNLAQQINAHTMVLHGGYMHYDMAGIKALRTMAKNNLIENLRILGDHAARKDIYIALENSPPNRYHLMVKDWQSHTHILKTVNHPQVKAILDIAHAHLHQLDIAHYYQKIKNYLVELHVHNNDGQSDLHTAIDEGTINYQKFFKQNIIHVPVIMEIRNISEAIQSLRWVKRVES